MTGVHAFVAVTIAVVGWAPVSRQLPQRRATVLVDFRALDADGHPVLDLKAADLILRVGGRERRVTSLELIRRDDGGPARRQPRRRTTSSAEAG